MPNIGHACLFIYYYLYTLIPHHPFLHLINTSFTNWCWSDGHSYCRCLPGFTRSLVCVVNYAHPLAWLFIPCYFPAGVILRGLLCPRPGFNGPRLRGLLCQLPGFNGRRPGITRSPVGVVYYALDLMGAGLVLLAPPFARVIMPPLSQCPGFNGCRCALPGPPLA